MAVTSKTIIGAGGGDYTTVAAWEAATTTASGTNIWKGVISNTGNYDEQVTIANAETIGASAYVWLTVDAAYRHAGVFGTYGRMDQNSNTTALTIQENYTRVDWLQMRDLTGSGGVALIYIDAAVSNFLIDYCLFLGHATTETGRYGLFIKNADISGSVSNSIFYGLPGNGILLESSAATNTQTLNLDHVTSVGNGRSGGGDYNANIGEYCSQAGSSFTINMYNCDIADALGTYEFGVYDGTGTLTVTGSNNARTSATEWHSANMDTDSTSSWVAVTNGHKTTPATAATIGVTTWDTSKPYASMNLTLDTDADNVALQAGTDRIGSEPDSRQDFAVAINGARTTSPDIGAFHVSPDTAIAAIAFYYAQMRQRNN